MANAAAKKAAAGKSLMYYSLCVVYSDEDSMVS